jgi:hypothetical protein
LATLAECFAFYGTTGRNPRWSWSARSADGSVVAMTFWIDRLNYKARPITYSELPAGEDHPWQSSPGNKERLDNLIWARDHLGGLLRVVFIKAVDTLAIPRKIADAHVREKLAMRLTSLDELTGHFTAEAVEI